MKMKQLGLVLLMTLILATSSDLMAQRSRITVRKPDTGAFAKVKDYYTIEIFETPSKLYKEYYLLKKFPGVRETEVDGIFKYDVGNYHSLKQAKDAQKKINKQGYAGKLVYINGDKRSYLAMKSNF